MVLPILQQRHLLLPRVVLLLVVCGWPFVVSFSLSPSSSSSSLLLSSNEGWSLFRNPQQKQRFCCHARRHSKDDDDDEPPIRIHRLPLVRRVYCISDLHVDDDRNMLWWRNKTAAMNFDFDESDLVVIAGDISHKMETIAESLELVLATGANVLFVPGNHEAWIDQRHTAKEYNSLDKLKDIEDLCHGLGVITTGSFVCVGGDDETNDDTDKAPNEQQQQQQQKRLWIVPLDGWYDASLSFVDIHDSDNNQNYDLIRDFGKWPWVDFRQCVWPSFVEQQQQQPPPHHLLRRIPHGLVDWFLQKNQRVLDALQHHQTDGDENDNDDILTVSHFLPNHRCLPDWKDLDSDDFDFGSWLDHGAGGMSAKFALVAGSLKIDGQIRTIRNNNNNSGNRNGNRIHVFGHSHRPKDFVYDGIRYIHNPLGKPRERDLYMVDPNVDLQLVWEATTEATPQQQPTQQVIRFWEERGGGLEQLRERMAAKSKAKAKLGRYTKSYNTTPPTK